MPIRQIWFKLFALLWMILIFTLSEQTGLPAPHLFPGQDKVAHIIVYSILGGFYALALCRADIGQLRCWLKICVLALLYGVTDEFHQSFVPGRDASGFDLVADGIGGLLGAWLAAVGLKIKWVRVVYPGT